MTLHYNYKHYFPIVLLDECDANHNFISIDAAFYKKLMSNSLNIPEPEKLSVTNSTVLPYLVVRDLEFYPTNEEYFTDV
jgi:hypothetical protein